MVVTLKVNTEKNKINSPRSPNSFENALAVMDTPFKAGSFQTPETKIANAVIEQTRIVSINGPIIATRPSLTGSFVFAAPCAITSVPNPASLENTALRIP